MSDDSVNFDEFEALLEGQDFAQVGVIVCVGLGPRASWPKRIREVTDTLILAYEPRERIRRQYRNVKGCLVSATLTQLRARMRAAAEDLDGDVLRLHDHTAPDDDVIAVQDAWSEAVRSADHKNMCSIFSAQDRVSQFLESFDLFVGYPPINHLVDVFAGKAGVVVGAGPSLDLNLAVLAEHRDKFVVACVNTSWPALESVGIIPDLVVICEAKQVSTTISDIPSLPKTIMVPGLHVHRDTWDLPWRKVAPALSNEGIFGEWATKILGVPPAFIGSSAACLAAGVLHLLGCDPIVLVGCDCAPSGSKLYSDVAAFAGTTVEHQEDGTTVITKSDAKLGVEDVGPRSRTGIMETVETWSWDRSERIESVLLYDQIRQWFEEVGDVWKGRRLVNATEGGAHILNWDHVPLTDVVADLEPLGFCARTAVCDALDAVDYGDGKSTVDIVTDAVNEQIEGAQNVGDLAREGIGLMRRAREVQQEIVTSGHKADLLDAFTWGQVEQARRRGDRPIFDIFQEIFQEIERGSIELKTKLETTKDRINEH